MLGQAWAYLASTSCPVSHQKHLGNPQRGGDGSSPFPLLLLYTSHVLGRSILISSLGAAKKPLLSLKSFLKTIIDPTILVINCGGSKADQHVTMCQFYKHFLEWLLTKVIQYGQILLETRNKSNK